MNKKVYKKNRRNLRNLVKNIAIKCGFITSGQTFIRRKEDFIQIIQLQASSYNREMNYIRSYLYYGSGHLPVEYNFSKDGFDISLLILDEFEYGSNGALITDSHDVDMELWRGELGAGLETVVNNLDELSTLKEVLADYEGPESVRRVYIYQRFRETLRKSGVDVSDH